MTPDRPLPAGSAVYGDHAKDIGFLNVNFSRNKGYTYSAYYCAQICYDTTFRNVKVINNTNGGIGIVKSSNILVENSLFSGNVNGIDGSSLGFFRTSRNLIIKNSTFKENTAIYGAGIYIDDCI